MAFSRGREVRNERDLQTITQLFECAHTRIYLHSYIASESQRKQACERMRSNAAACSMTRNVLSLAG